MFRVLVLDRVEQPWTEMVPVRVGPVPPHLPTPAAFVCVEKENRPLLRVDVYGRAAENSAFCEAIVWREYVVVGIGGGVHLVGLSGAPVRTFSFERYFGYLYPGESHLLAASAERLYCIDADARLLWVSDVLGIDGVVVDRIDADWIDGEGDWDPPDGWRRFRIRRDTGQA
jgi:hypothetical protein